MDCLSELCNDLYFLPKPFNQLEQALSSCVVRLDLQLDDLLVVSTEQRLKLELLPCYFYELDTIEVLELLQPSHGDSCLFHGPALAKVGILDLKA